MRLIIFFFFALPFFALSQNTKIHLDKLKKAPGKGYIPMSKSDSSYRDTLIDFDNIVFDSTFFPTDSSNVYPGKSVLTPSGRIFYINEDSTPVYRKLYQNFLNPNDRLMLFNFGQSLTEGVAANGQATAYEKGALDRIKIFSAKFSGFVPLDIGTNNNDFFINSPFQHGDELSIGVEFENRYPNDTLRIVKASVGSSPSTNWHPYGWNMRMTIDGTWRPALNEVLQDGYIARVLFHKSIFTDGDAQAIIDSSEIWYQSIVREFGHDVPIILSTHPLGDLSFPINQGVRELCARNKNFFLHDYTGIATSDGTHPTYAGYKDYADDFWDLVENWGLWGKPITKQRKQTYGDIDYSFESYEIGEQPRELFYAATGDFDITTHAGSKQLRAINFGEGYSKRMFQDSIAMIGIQEMPYSTLSADSISVSFDATMTAQCNFGLSLDTRYEFRNATNPPERINGSFVWIQHEGNNILWERASNNLQEGTTAYTMPLNVQKRFRVQYKNPQLRVYEVDGAGVETLLFSDSHFASGNFVRGRSHFLFSDSTVFIDNVDVYFGTKTGIYQEGGSNNGSSLSPTGVLAGTYGSSTEVPIMTINEFGQVEQVSNAPINNIDTNFGNTDIIFSSATSHQLFNNSPLAFSFTSLAGGLLTGQNTTTGKETWFSKRLSANRGVTAAEYPLHIGAVNNGITAQIGGAFFSDYSTIKQIGWEALTPNAFAGVHYEGFGNAGEAITISPNGFIGGGTGTFFADGSGGGGLIIREGTTPTNMNFNAGMLYTDGTTKRLRAYNENSSSWEDLAYLSDITGVSDQTLFSDPQTFGLPLLEHTLTTGEWAIWDGSNDWLRMNGSSNILSTGKHWTQGSTYSHLQTKNSTSGSTILMTINPGGNLTLPTTFIDGFRRTIINDSGNSFLVGGAGTTTVDGSNYDLSDKSSITVEYDVSNDNWYLVCETGGSIITNDEIAVGVSSDVSTQKTNPFILIDTLLNVGVYSIESSFNFLTTQSYSGDTTRYEFNGAGEIYGISKRHVATTTFTENYHNTLVDDIWDVSGIANEIEQRNFKLTLNVTSSGNFKFSHIPESITHTIKPGTYCLIKKIE